MTPERAWRESRRIRIRRRRWIAAGVLAVVGVFAVIALIGSVRAVRAGSQGRAALVRAEAHLRTRALDPARQDLARADEAFGRMRHELGELGPLGTLGRFVPVVGTQLDGADTLAAAGEELAQAGLRLTEAVAELTEPGRPETIESGGVETMRVVHAALVEGRAAVEAAATRVTPLEGRLLVGPVHEAWGDLRERLPRVRRQLASAEEGLAALITFVGGEGPRRYLFFTQNPDEPRPTGGFMGTYSVLVADGGDVDLQRFADTNEWSSAHPDALVPAAEAPAPFGFGVAGPTQRLGNTNAVADWAEAAGTAMAMWERGGEEPVHGVVSVLPAFMHRILAITGPVEVPEYDETVGADNLMERLTFYSHNQRADRKDFLGAMAEVVLPRVLATPPEGWVELGEAVGAAFDAREAMAYSSDESVQAVLADRGWDGRLPEVPGDFFYNAEFSYAAKNGRGLRRTFDHHVELRTDGSARVTTDITIANTDPPDPQINTSSLTYLRAYGPVGATEGEGTTFPGIDEAPVGGHPGAAWFVAAPPGGQATVRVVWEVPSLLVETDGDVAYRLRWMRVADHQGDVLNLSVTLPEGWAWADGPPPATVELTEDLVGTWVIAPDV